MQCPPEAALPCMRIFALSLLQKGPSCACIRTLPDLFLALLLRRAILVRRLRAHLSPRKRRHWLPGLCLARCQLLVAPRVRASTFAPPQAVCRSGEPHYRWTPLG